MLPTTGAVSDVALEPSALADCPHPHVEMADAARCAGAQHWAERPRASREDAAVRASNKRVASGGGASAGAFGWPARQMMKDVALVASEPAAVAPSRARQ